MKQALLLETIQALGLSLPEFGTGRNRRIISRDLEDTIGDHFFKQLPDEDKLHMDNRLQIRPMKSFLFNKLTQEQKDEVLKDNNNWVAEQKLNGMRMVLSYVPANSTEQDMERMKFFGGNLSTVTFLPLDYTSHVMLTQPIVVPEEITSPILIDCECICEDMVLTQDGLLTTDTREAVTAILGSSPTESMSHQAAGAKLRFRGFHVIDPYGEEYSWDKQQAILQLIADANEGNVHFERVKPVRVNKLQYTQRLWKQGEEGVVLKNTNELYVSGGRLRGVSVKLKRTMAGEIGDTIDAFISSFVLTEEHSKENLIGGVVLSVYLNGEPHEIATVSNMPDKIRRLLTVSGADGVPKFDTRYLGKVLEVDGQELSTRNTKLMHAVVERWEFRGDKNATECTLELDDMGGDF